MFDVYLYGMISSSTVHILDTNSSFPRANSYAEIGHTIPSVGGEAVNSAVVLSRLGLRTKLDGNWLNKKNAGKILKILEPFGIDSSRLRIVDTYGTEEIVIVDPTTRTVFGNYAAFHGGEKQWNTPREEDVCNVRMVSIDPFFRNDSALLAQMCVKNNKPYVTIDCRHDDFMAQNAASVIVSHELLDHAYKDCDKRATFGKYLAHCKGLTIFTSGGDDLWYARPGEELKTFSPFKIQPLDTTGAGDSFRGGIIYGLLQGWGDERTIQFACAVAANVCLTRPHALNVPGIEVINEFIRNHKTM